MQLTSLNTEMRKPQWVLDTVTCIIGACGLYIFMIWLTRTFRTTPPKLFEPILMIVLAYTLSAIAGSIFMKKRWRSFIWVSIVGSALFGLIRMGLAVPGSIEYYYRFTPDESFLTYLIRFYAGMLFWNAVIFFGGYVSCFGARSRI